MKFFKIMSIFLLLLIIPYTIIAIDVYQFSQQDEARPADAAIVLGAGVIQGQPSPVLRERINHAIQLYEDGYVHKIIFTGGVGFRDEKSEAEIARDYALAHGIPNHAILLDTSSTNTVENLANAQSIAQENNASIETFLIVSTPFHMRRAMALANDLGIEAYSSPTHTIQWINWITKSYAFLREVIAYVVYLIAG